MGSTTMDWAAVASALGERSDRPIVVVDRFGRIRMLNHAMEQVLGWRRFEVEDAPWATACTPREYQDAAPRWIDAALRGALRSFEVHGLAKSGEQIVFRFEFTLVGRGATQALLLTATSWRPAVSSPRLTEGRELDYDIVSDLDVFGEVQRLIVDSERVPLPTASPRCFAVIHGLAQPCDGCPVLRRDDEGWPRVLVRHIEDANTSAFEIKSAERVDKGHVRVRTRRITAETLEAIHAAKIQQLADRAELSAREREVLSYLLLGRTLEDISTEIGIAVRTVKYHQANVLQKLGADSRSDLMRLLF